MPVVRTPIRPPRRRPPPRRLIRRRWLALGLPASVVAGLVAIAPPLPIGSATGGGTAFGGSGREPFRFHADRQAYALDFDPRRVQIDLLEGWDRETEAYADSGALAFLSGPMYERHLDPDGRERTVPLGDLKLGGRIWRSRNRAAARQRAAIGIRHDGRAEFLYGELTPERTRRYDTFIGGLHSIYNDLEAPPPGYRGAYSVGMGQQIRYHLPRIRVVLGLRPDGRVEALMSRDGLTLEQTRSLARQRRLLAAYLPDHASKSRFIVPGVKGFSQEDANWISGGATSFVHVPYLLRLSERNQPLRGSPLTALTPRLSAGACGDLPLCLPNLPAQLLDRTLAGFNRLMEQGVEPIARLIWAPHGTPAPKRRNLIAPLREPPITADPLALRQRQERPITTEATPPEPPELPEDDLEAPLVLPEGGSLETGDGRFNEPTPSPDPGITNAQPPPPVEATEQPGEEATGTPPSPPPPLPLPLP